MTEHSPLKRNNGKHPGTATVLILTLVLLAALGACQPAMLKSPADMVFHPVSFPFPQVEPVTLPNGMVLYLKEDHELPLINLIALLRAGSAYEPEDRLGLASLTGVVMRTGGTRSLSADEINPLHVADEVDAGRCERSVPAEVAASLAGRPLRLDI